MKLNWAERWVVNNPTRVAEQKIEMKWFKKTMSLAPGAEILEIGCGRGAGAKLIRQAFRPAALHAQDLDLAMIQRAKGYLKAADSKAISLSVADANRLPFKALSLDAVFGFGVLHHIPDWQTALGEIARVLKPGGVYFIEELYPALYQNFITKHIVLHPRYNRFFSPDLKAALNQVDLYFKAALEFKPLGILAVAIKGFSTR